MHNHNHYHCCEHKNLKYCEKCDVVYCVDCGKEWGRKWSYTTWSNPWDTGTVTNVHPWMDASTCNHNPNVCQQ